MMQTKTWRWLCTGVFCLITYTGGTETFALVQSRAAAQRAATAALQAWTDQYKALQPVEAAWDSAYPMQTPKDLHAVLQLLGTEGLGLDVPAQLFSTTGTINPVEYGGQKLGIYSLCVQNGGGNSGLTATAIDYPTLFMALESLAVRKDLSFTQVSIQNGAVPSMTLANTCLLLKPN
jgi:hypothetical protein